MQTMRKEWVEKDYYATLGVAKDATQADIKKAFRKLARANHPDNNPDDPEAEGRFKEVNEAYDTLSDPEQRKEYDHIREMGYFVGGPGGGQQYVRVEDLLGSGGAGSPFDLFGGLGDLFGRTSRGPRPTSGRDISTDIDLTFHEALGGVTKQIDLGGSSVKVKIPKGVSDGTRIRVAGKGEPGSSGGRHGDLYVRVHVADHPIFKRKGKRDLTVTVPITFTEAALGAAIDVPTLDGKTRIRIPPGTQSGQTLRVSGKGIETDKGAGDLMVTVEVAVPKVLTDEQRELLEKLRSQAAADNPRSHLGV
jgi:molecular chaperone DnaJ